MSTIPASMPTDKYGIDDIIPGFVIESMNKTTAPVIEQVRDQHNAVVREIKYDTRYDLSLTVRGEREPIADDLDKFAGAEKWIIDNIESAGSYNGLKRYNIKAHHSTNCNSITDIEKTQSDNTQSS